MSEKFVKMTEKEFIEYSNREFYILDLKAENERLRVSLSEAEKLIFKFSKEFLEAVNWIKQHGGKE